VSPSSSAPRRDLGQMLRCLVVIGHDLHSDHPRRGRCKRRELIAIRRECGMFGDSHSADGRFGDPEVVRADSGRAAVALHAVGEKCGMVFVKGREPV